MFGKRSSSSGQTVAGARPAPVSAPAPFKAESIGDAKVTPPPAPRSTPQPTKSSEAPRTDDYYVTKGMIFGALIEAIDLSQLSRLDPESAREEIRDIVNEIISIKNFVMSIAEQEDLLD